jgi:DNA-directed RNA polymerase subunit N
MIIPIRCFTCGTVVAAAHERYRADIEDGKDPKESLDATGLERFCCRRMIVAHRDLISEAARYE